MNLKALNQEYHQLVALKKSGYVPAKYYGAFLWLNGKSYTLDDAILLGLIDKDSLIGMRTRRCPSNPQIKLFCYAKTLIPTFKLEYPYEIGKGLIYIDIFEPKLKKAIEYGSSRYHTKKNVLARIALMKQLDIQINYYIDRVPTLKELESDLNDHGQ